MKCLQGINDVYMRFLVSVSEVSVCVCPLRETLVLVFGEDVVQNPQSTLQV